jgi:hypothetical protein
MKRVAGQRAGGSGVRESAGSAGATGAWRSLRRTAHDQPKLSGQRMEQDERGIHAVWVGRAQAASGNHGSLLPAGTQGHQG